MTLRSLLCALTLISLLALACQLNSSDRDVPPAKLDAEAMTEELYAASRHPSRLERIRRWSAALAQVDATNLDAAREAVVREHWWFQSPEIQMFLEAWTRIDPPEALAFADRWPDPTRRAQAMGAVLRAWALADPEEAASQAKRLSRENLELEATLVENVLKGWVESGEPGVLAFASQGDDFAHSSSALYIAGAQARLLGDVPAILSWADEVLAQDLPHKLRLNLCRRVAGMAGRLDPIAVSVWLAPHADAPYADGAARLLMERWFPIDADAAINWAAESYPEDSLEKIVTSGLTKWFTRDREAAASWISTVPADSKYDAARNVLAIAMSRRNAEKALPWASEIVDVELRQSTLQEVASNWYRRDPLAAEAWLESSDLDEAARTEVRQAPKQRRKRRVEP